MHPISEIAFYGFSLIGVVISPLLLADAPPAQQFALQWLLLPLLGALLSSVCAMLLNPHPEARKVVLGRCILGVMIGTALPKVATLLHPAIREWSLDPAFACLAGFSVCLIAYVCARPFVEKLFARSGSFVDKGLDAAEDRFTNTGSDK